MTPEEQARAEPRFWGYVHKIPDGCWLWRGPGGAAAYGEFSVSRNTRMRPHRFAWEIAHGSVPRTHQVVHEGCGNPLCVNVEHLAMRPKKNPNPMPKVSRRQ